MKLTIIVFSIVAALMGAVVLWEILGPEDPVRSCQTSCRAKSAEFKTAAEFRKCNDGCEQ